MLLFGKKIYGSFLTVELVLFRVRFYTLIGVKGQTHYIFGADKFTRTIDMSST
jgi:hypothetical protein